VPLVRIVPDGDDLYVLTNSGALAAINGVEQRVEWMYLYKRDPSYASKAGVHRGVFIGGQVVRLGGARFVGQPRRGGGIVYLPQPHAVMQNGTLYFKPGDATSAYAIHVAGRRLQWKYKMSADDTLVTVDAKRMYLQGQTLKAIDLRTRKTAWYCEHFNKGGGPVTVTADQFFAPTAKGVLAVSRSGGKVVGLFNVGDEWPRAGQIAWSKNRLICTVPNEIVAFKLPEESPED
jgi:hypothetical protein